MRIYLAARYSRRLELCAYRRELRAMGHDVRARWLDGEHQISNEGTPIGDEGEALVEGDSDEAGKLRMYFAWDDWNDVTGAELLINFTEPPRSSASRGGRHVEFGIALALGIPVIVVGYRENIFHWLPQIDFYATWEEARRAMGGDEDAGMKLYRCPLCGWKQLSRHGQPLCPCGDYRKTSIDGVGRNVHMEEVSDVTIETPASDVEAEGEEAPPTEAEGKN